MMNKIKQFYKNNKFLFLLFGFSFLIRLIIILLIDTPLFSDFETMYNASLELVNKTSNYKKTIYFLTWGYQMGHVVYQYLLLKIWNNVFFLKLINIIVTSFIPVLIYLISKKVTTEKTAKIISVLYSVFLFPLLLNTVLTNQHLPLLLNLIVIYLIINMKYNKVIKISLIVGLLLGISNILRSEGIVYITCIFLYSIYLIIKKYDIKKIIISFLLIIFTYFCTFNLSSFILMKTDISENGLKNMNPTWKFVAGFNYETNGVYSDEDASKYSSYLQVNETKKELNSRITKYDQIPLLFLKKIKILWFNSDLSWSLGYLNNNITYKILTFINQIFIVVFNILTILSLIKFKNIKHISKTQIIITLILFIYFGVYLLIEVMPRYAYSIQPFIFILGGITIDQIRKKYCRKRFQ